MAKRGRGERRAFLIIIIVFTLVLSTAAYLAFTQNASGPSSSGPAPRYPLYIWKVSLTIQILKADNSVVNVTLPPNVGLAGGFWTNHTLDDWGIPGETAPLHTQSSNGNASVSDGFIYVEPTKTGLNFTIADFFSIWGYRISNSCVSLPNYALHCTGSQGVLSVEVGGFAVARFAGQPLGDGERMSIIYIEANPP